jgi:hypothetical protein
MLAAIGHAYNGNISSSGFEFATAVFVLVTGIAGVQTTFKFAQANNLSRKTFFRGTLLSVPLIAASLAFLDCVLIRLYNLMMPVFSFFSMVYLRKGGNIFITRPGNNLSDIFASFMWLFTLYASLFMFGLLIGLSVYRSNRIVKILLALSPIILFLFIINSRTVLPYSFWPSIGVFLSAAFGVSSANPYMAVFSFTFLFGLYSSGALLILRRMTIKD